MPTMKLMTLGSVESVSVLNRTMFGPPLPIKDELAAVGSISVARFFDSYIPDDSDWLWWCAASYLQLFPTVAAVDEYIATSAHDYSTAEIAGFLDSPSYAYLRHGNPKNISNRLGAEQYVRVAIRFGDWTETNNSNNPFDPRIEPPAGFFDAVRDDCSESVGFSALSGPNRNQCLRYIPQVKMSALSYVAARNPQALHDLPALSNFITNILMHNYRVKMSKAKGGPMARSAQARRSGFQANRQAGDIINRFDWEKRFEPLVGESWLAWMLLIFQSRDVYWRSSSSLGALSDIMGRSDELGGFDAAAPYLHAGVPLHLIGDAARHGVSPDVAMAAQ